MGINKVKRPALKYYGGKWRIAPWIIGHFPPHRHYIEPCFGGGNVLLRKEPSELETVNDINHRLVNFFRQLRDNPEELIRRIETTPWARAEYNSSKIESEDPVEDARRFFLMAWMSISGAPVAVGFRHSKVIGTKWIIIPQDIIKHSLVEVANRIRPVQIMCDNAMEFVEGFNNDPEGLIYFDPPYPKKVRKGSFYGEYELFDELHEPASQLLRKSKSFVIVSGYRSDIYDELYDGWKRIDKEHYVQSNRKRVESIWLSPKTVEALNDLDNS